jgi:putative methanogenesis marker protein 1
MTARIELHSSPKTYYIDTHRVMPPAETLKHIKAIVPNVGVTRIADISGLDRVGIPVYSAIRPSAADGAISVYAGKGTTEAEARVSVIMEAIERFAAEVDNFKDTLVFGSFNELRDDYDVLSPQSLILPGSFPSETPIEWYESWDLLNNKDILVPANAVFHPYTPTKGRWQLFRSNTNGLASGNVMEEAIFHGLMEVIERDALSIAEANRDPGIGLEASGGIVHKLLHKFNTQGVAIKLWYLKADTDIPTVVAASDDERLRDPALLVIGAGTHMDPTIAAIRALTEVAQSRVTQIHGAREDTDRESITRRIGYERMKRLNNHWFKEPPEVADLENIHNISTTSLDGDIKAALNLLRSVVERVIVSNITVDTIGVPAVRVIVPGFEVYFIDKERKGLRCKR